MSCTEAQKSKPKSNLPLVVYTNSESDYRVTVRSVAPVAGAETLAAELARRCDPWIDGQFVALVGGVSSPSRDGHVLAFRVFNVGAYFNRPHTVAVVVVEAPRAGAGDRPVAQLLAALPPPQPGSADYRIPTDVDIDAASIDSPPFAAFAAWERALPVGASIDRPVFFATPSHVAPSVAELLPRPKRLAMAHRAKLFAAIGAVVLILAATVASFRALSSAGSDSLPTASLSTVDREQLAALLVRSGGRLTPGLNDDKLRIAVIASSQEIRRRLRELQAQLDRRQSDPDSLRSGSVDGIIRHYDQDWKRPIETGHEDRPAIDQLSLDDARLLHARYQRVRDTLGRLANTLAPDGDEYRDTLTSLERELDAALR